MCVHTYVCLAELTAVNGRNECFSQMLFFLAGEITLHLAVELEIHDLPFTGHACRRCSNWQL